MNETELKYTIACYLGALTYGDRRYLKKGLVETVDEIHKEVSDKITSMGLKESVDNIIEKECSKHVEGRIAHATNSAVKFIIDQIPPSLRKDYGETEEEQAEKFAAEQNNKNA